MGVLREEVERVSRLNPTVGMYRTNLAAIYIKLGMVQERAGISSDAVIRTLKKGAGLLEDLHLQASQDYYPLQELFECCDKLGQILARAGRIDEAIDYFRKSVELGSERVNRYKETCFRYLIRLSLKLTWGRLWQWPGGTMRLSLVSERLLRSFVGPQAMAPGITPKSAMTGC